MVNERRSPSASEEAGVKGSVVPTSTCLAGDPEIEGARLVALTRMVNDGNAREDFPSLTTISDRSCEACVGSCGRAAERSGAAGYQRHHIGLF